MNKTYFSNHIPQSNTKSKHQTINIQQNELQSRKHSRSLMIRDDRCNNLMQPYENRRYSAYKTPTNAKRKHKYTSTQISSNGKTNYRQIVGSPFSKIKVKNIVQSGSFVKEIKDIQSKKKAPVGYKILKQIQNEQVNIFVAEKISQQLIVYLQLNPSKHLMKFYKHFYNEDKVKRTYLKNSYLKTILAPKYHNTSILTYTFQGEWPLITQLQSFVQSQNSIDIKDNALGNLLKNDTKSIKRIISDVCKMLLLLQQHKIIHGHLRKSSLLVILSTKNTIKSTKIYGFDKWLYFTQFQNKYFDLISLYTPPEVLNFVKFQKQIEFDRGMLTFMQTYNQGRSWLFDMWSLGIIILEIVLGFPLYLSKQAATLNGVQFQPVFKKDTSLQQIIQKQLDIVFSLNSILKQKNTIIAQDPQIQFLLKTMLNINPSKRMSPKEVLNYLS